MFKLFIMKEKVDDEFALGVREFAEYRSRGRGAKKGDLPFH